MMDVKKMSQALLAAGVDLKKHQESFRPENAAVLAAMGMDQTAIDFFATFSFNEAVSIGSYSYDQTNCFKKQIEWEEEFQRAAKANLLVVGSALNGDVVVLDLADYQVGLLKHEEFWEDQDVNPREYLVKMNCSLGQFFWNAISDEDYPQDAYEAAEYTNADARE
ncbi:hypothetical protein [Hymenobacter latericus]|uniref:hypothetical protein n=1 Tax=Hymenobacter sp. YIM 151858-1 TaxID=2987688 RepID=UPI002227CA05|nr:hypothetical protein [Hymenobacter sp. YIM 151858-1]UYZ59989.1 hypothetical protein OIS50_04135 [Hymenobacter sp. YIM 151858-1]